MLHDTHHDCMSLHAFTMVFDMISCNLGDITPWGFAPHRSDMTHYTCHTSHWEWTKQLLPEFSHKWLNETLSKFIHHLSLLLFIPSPSSAFLTVKFAELLMIQVWTVLVLCPGVKQTFSKMEASLQHLKLLFCWQLC